MFWRNAFTDTKGIGERESLNWICKNHQPHNKKKKPRLFTPKPHTRARSYRTTSIRKQRRRKRVMKRKEYTNTSRSTTTSTRTRTTMPLLPDLHHLLPATERTQKVRYSAQSELYQTTWDIHTLIELQERVSVRHPLPQGSHQWALYSLFRQWLLSCFGHSGHDVLIGRDGGIQGDLSLSQLENVLLST